MSDQNDVSQMEAGRELDALVAEKVMGWVWLKAMMPYRPEPLLYRPERVAEFLPEIVAERRVVGHCGEPPHMTPHYSTSIADAWLVVEKLCGTTQFYVTVGSAAAQSTVAVKAVRDEWVCVVGLNDGRSEPIAVAQAPNPAEAICRAALLSLGGTS